MAIPSNKNQLIEFAKSEYVRLFELVSQLTVVERDKKFVFGNRTTKDIVAHLYAWQNMTLNWYQDGVDGKKPTALPAGYTIKDIPKLNEKLYLEYKDIHWDTLKSQLNTSHNKLLKIIKNYTNSELFTKKKYDWTGTTCLAVYFRLALSSHYVWAIDLIRKFIKKDGVIDK